ncbi:hypothetical protein BT69DRAFT_128679 [Atractiella rhizophila]|nr:hypothetical protein BT69DRAFT_128679 [Atractiella rhizophila]
MIGVMESLHPELTLCGDHFKAQFFLQEQLNEVHKLWREEDGLEPKFTRLKGEAPDGLESSLGSRPSTPLPASCAGVTLKSLLHTCLDRRKPNKRARTSFHASLQTAETIALRDENLNSEPGEPDTMEVDIGSAQPGYLGHSTSVGSTLFCNAFRIIARSCYHLKIVFAVRPFASTHPPYPRHF